MVKVSKKYDRDFTIIQNSFFKFNERLPKEDKLGFKEAGIFWYLWHLPSDWEFHESEIVNHFKDKIDSFRTGRQKLEKYGFITKVRNRNKQGQVGAYQWILDDDPKFKPSLDFPKQEKTYYGKNLYREKPTQENPHLQSTNSTNDVSNKVLNATTTSACLNFYKENVGKLPPIVSQQIQQYCNNMTPELVKEAISRSVESGKSWRNAKGILESWQLKKVSSLDDVKQDDDNFAKSKQPKPHANYGRPTINKKIPESMKEKYDPEKDKLSPERKAEVERMLEEFQRSAEDD